MCISSWLALISLVNLQVLEPWVGVVSWGQGVAEGICGVLEASICSLVSHCLQPILGWGSTSRCVSSSGNWEYYLPFLPIYKGEHGYEKDPKYLACSTNTGFLSCACGKAWASPCTPYTHTPYSTVAQGLGMG